MLLELPTRLHGSRQQTISIRSIRFAPQSLSTFCDQSRSIVQRLAWAHTRSPVGGAPHGTHGGHGLCSLNSFPHFPFIFPSRYEARSDPAWFTGRKTQSVALGRWQFGRADKGSKAGRVYKVGNHGKTERKKLATPTKLTEFHNLAEEAFAAGFRFRRIL